MQGPPIPGPVAKSLPSSPAHLEHMVQDWLQRNQTGMVHNGSVDIGSLNFILGIAFFCKANYLLV